MQNISGIQQIRNATVIISYAGKRILVDPMLSAKGTYPGFEGTANSHLRNPLVELPIPMNQIINVDAVIVTHLHPDHWDDEAQEQIPKDMLIFCQNQKEREYFEKGGFTNVRLLEDKTEWEGITMIKTSGMHGTPETVKAIDILDEVCGVILKHPAEKVIYLAGDSVWNDSVKESIDKYDPAVIILNAGGAVVEGFPPIIMDEKDVEAVVDYTNDAQIITTHHEAVNHCLTTRESLSDFLKTRDKALRVNSPLDGEFVSFN